ncbi:MAG TPA: fibronectin type III domain-containing protein [Thermoanaerobacterales bacterium]|nr:fibronectin type III domain-containing protein [Thermoanaerobacterales bacterium]
MAGIKIVGRDHYWIEYEIYGLQYSARLYDQFEVILHNRENNTPVEIDQFTTGASGDSFTIRFHNLCPNTSYLCVASAKWSGAWYTIGDVTGSTPSSPAPQWLFFRAISATEIEGLWTHVSGAWGDHFRWKLLGSSTWAEGTAEGTVTSFLLHELSPGTTYQCEVRAVFKDNSGYTVYSPFSTTQSATTESVQIDAPLWWSTHIKALSPSSLQIGWYKGDCEAWWVEARQLESDWYDVGGTYENIVVLVDAAPDVTYYFRVKGYKNGFWGPYSSVISVKTFSINAPLWNGSQCYTGSQNIHLGWYGVDWADNYWIDFRYSPAGDAFAYVELDGSNRSVNVTGFDPETKYYITVEAVHLTENETRRFGPPSSMISLTTLPIGVPDFEWDMPKISGNTFNLTALEWNDFTTTINDKRNYKELPPYSFTTAYTNNNFAAAMYNQSNVAIGNMITTGISTQSAGDEIHADLLNTLKDKLNSIT